MSENAIELEPVGNLLGKTFFIPNYQRGYRWKKQQVEDLLNDIDEFIELQKKSEKNDGFYCIQPLVVKGISNKDAAQNIRNAVNKNDEEFIQYVKDETQIAQWEVIDGQQRLTTIFLLLSYLFNELELEGSDAQKYSIQYETRQGNEDTSKRKIGSFEFLSNITKTQIGDRSIADLSNENIDFFHMFNAYKTIEDWFEPKDENKKSDDEKTKFKDTLLNQVKFIWYESTDEDPIKVFTRLNIGKISLTNAELIKALFLNRSNFFEGDANIRLKQQEIASEWDKIEYTLQNDEFWLFLNQRGYDKPTRIDMIFNLICEKDRLSIGEKNIGTDQYKTFRYFNNFFKLEKDNYPKSFNNSEKTKIEYCWSKVKEVFQIFEEWYNDLELYHYVGYLVDQGEKISELLTLWMAAKSKQDFIGKLKEKIIQKICKCCTDTKRKEQCKGLNPLTNEKCNILIQQYKVEDKTNCKSLILLHNVQTVIIQNSNSEETYKLSVFYKFPFHLYKSEKWDVEHIDSNTENNLEDLKSQKEWLKDISLDIQDDHEHKELSDKIRNFIQNSTSNEKSEVQDKTFKELCDEVEKYSSSTNPDRLQENNNDIDEKNLIWNYCLLDSSTNRSYGNAIFSVKRRIIIGKDQGKTFSVTDELKIDEKESEIAFVLPCTKNVFLKYYNPSTNVLRAWTREDAKEYLLNINDVLSKAGFISDQKTKIDEKMNEGENNNE